KKVSASSSPGFARKISSKRATSGAHHDRAHDHRASSHAEHSPGSAAARHSRVRKGGRIPGSTKSAERVLAQRDYRRSQKGGAARKRRSGFSYRRKMEPASASR